MEIDPRLAEEWDSLADRTRAVPWTRPAWVSAWWRAFGSGDLEILTAREESTDGPLGAVLPVARKGGRVSGVTNWHSPELPLVTCMPQGALGLGQQLFRSARSITLRSIPERAVDSLRKAAAAAGYRLL